MLGIAPKGLICLIATGITIPPGWTLCDGTNGTPDLRDKFSVGAGTTYNPDDSGGSVNHTHEATTNGHRHDVGYGSPALKFGAGFDERTSTEVDTFTSDIGNVLPPYHALRYIMSV